VAASLSVIIPAFNAEPYLSEALDSVLAQTVRPAEIVVVDDGSTDDTAAVVERYPGPVHLLRGAHEGQGAAWNRGLAAAQGAYIALLDADDLWVADKLERQLDWLERDPRIDLLFGRVRQFISPDVDPALARRLRCPTEAMDGYLPSALLARRTVFERVGPFRTDWRLAQFVDWTARALELGCQRALLPEVVLWRRLHAHNVGLNDPNGRTDYVRAVKAALDRRRRA
jgi:glycosyltransferase involved in cell wall biosynthesis